jgi:Flp pilus assembly protein TadD
VSPGRLPLRELLLVAAVAVASRVLFEVQVRAGDGPVAALAGTLLGDERSYDLQARRFAAGGPPRERAFYQEPLYPWLLSLVYRAAPVPDEPAERALVPAAPVHIGVVVAQHLLGVLTCLGIALLGARALSPRVGLIAGLLAALSGPLIFTESQLIKESIAILLWVATLHVWLDVLQDRGPRRALALGLLLGVGVLLRGNTYILLALVLLSLLLRVDGRRRLAEAGLVLGCALLALAPATIHNLRRGELVLSTYQAGANAAIGMPDSDDPADGVVYRPLRAGHGDARHEEADAVALAEEAAGRRLSGPEVSRFWWRRALAAAAAQPAAAAGRTARKLACTFSPDEVPDVKDWAFVREAAPLLATPLSDLTLWGPLALLGLLLLPWRGAGLLVVRGSVLAVMLSLALFYVMGRYRLSAAPGLWILGAGALVAAWERIAAAHGGRRVALAAGCLALGALAVAAGRVPLRHDVGGVQASWVNVALIELDRAEHASSPAEAVAHRDAAVAAARAALLLAPNAAEPRQLLLAALDLETPALPARREEADAEALRLLLVVESRRTGAGSVEELLERSRDEQLAAAARLRALPSAPGEDARASPLLALAARRVANSIRTGAHLPLALELAREAQRRAPEEPAALVIEGQVLRRMGRIADAEQAWRAAVAAGVESVELFNNLGNLLQQAGRNAEALPFLQRALQLDPRNPIVLQNLQKAQAGLPPETPR